MALSVSRPLMAVQVCERRVPGLQPRGVCSFPGLPVLKHVLTPRVKATHIAFDSMKNYLDAIYDVTVAFEGTVDEKGQRKEAPSMVGESLASPTSCVSPGPHVHL